MSGPRLLDKKVVNAQIATQKKEQIDAGVALAKKIDTLRETLQNEESKLQHFRTVTIAKIQKEIDSKIRERDEIEYQIQRTHTLLSDRENDIQKREDVVTRKEEYVKNRFKLLEKIISEID